MTPAPFIHTGFPCEPLLAVVPFRRLLLQWLLSFLPQILVLLATLAMCVLAYRARGHLRQRLNPGGVRRWTVLIAAFAVTCALGIGLSVLPWRSRPLNPPAGSQRSLSVGPWLSFMGGPLRTGGAPGTSAPAVGEKLWAFCDGLSRAPFAGSPAVCGDRVYVGSDNGKLYCFNAFTGAVIWTFQARFALFASPVVADGRVYLGEGLHEAANASLYCLDAATGKPLWTFPTTSHIEFSPTLWEGRLYVGAGDDGLYCLDAATGKKLWQRRGVHVDMSSAVTKDRVFFGNVYGQPRFRSLDPKTGDLLWEKPAPQPICGSPSTDGRIVCFGLGNGTYELSHAQPQGSVWCLSAHDGTEQWHVDVPDAVLTTIALSDGSAYFGSRDGRFYCVDVRTGKVRWSFDTHSPVLSSPAVVDGCVCFGSNNGRVYCLATDTGKPRWDYDTSPASFASDARVISSPALAADRLYVGSMNFFFLPRQTRTRPCHAHTRRPVAATSPAAEPSRTRCSASRSPPGRAAGSRPC